MVNSKPFVIEYHKKRVLVGREYLDKNGKPFKSVQALRKAYEYKDAMILFCPECGTGNRESAWGEGPRFMWEKKHTLSCPACGKKITLRYSYDITRSTMIEKKPGQREEIEIPVMMAGGTNPACFDVALKWWPVEDGKLAIETVQELCASRTMYEKYWIERSLLRHRFIFNLKTGQTYIMRGVDGRGNPSKYSFQKNRLQNYSFARLHGVPLEMRKDFVRVVVEALREYKGLDIQTIYEENERGERVIRRFEYCGHCIGTDHIAKLNYFADMKPQEAAKMMRIDFEPYENPAAVQNIKKVMPRLIELSSKGEVEWLPKYMQKPSIRKRLRQRSVLYYVYKRMHNYGVRDVNIMNNVVDALIAADGDGRASGAKHCLEERILNMCMKEKPDARKFMRWVMREKSAASATQFLVDMFNTDKVYLFTDSVRMFNSRPSNAPLGQPLGNIKDIHDELVVLNRKWKNINRKIEYSDFEKALEIDCGEYSFHLAKDTDTLYDIGKEMGICVGSYGRHAVAKECTILTMQRAQKHVACIELRVKQKNATMVQLKSKYNHTVSEIEPIVQWVEATGINADSCYDYRNAVDGKTGSFDRRNQDYHVENPRFWEINGPREDDEALPPIYDDGPLPF